MFLFMLECSQEEALGCLCGLWE